MTPTADIDPRATLPEIAPIVDSEVGAIPEMNSPISRTLEELSSSSSKTQESSAVPRDVSRDSPEQERSPDNSEVVRELLSECLLEDDSEFGEDWVLENRPLSFCED